VGRQLRFGFREGEAAALDVDETAIVAADADPDEVAAAEGGAGHERAESGEGAKEG
jgi:hypothetical protein